MRHKKEFAKQWLLHFKKSPKSLRLSNFLKIILKCCCIKFCRKLFYAASCRRNTLWCL